MGDWGTGGLGDWGSGDLGLGLVACMWGISRPGFGRASQILPFFAPTLTPTIGDRRLGNGGEWVEKGYGVEKWATEEELGGTGKGTRDWRRIGGWELGMDLVEDKHMEREGRKGCKVTLVSLSNPSLFHPYL